MAYIPLKLRTSIQELSHGYCEYCLMPSNLSPAAFEIDHIIPESLGGATLLENLAYSCGGCNGYKTNKINYIDPLSYEEVRLFHPRNDDWLTHFQWNNDETVIIGQTPIGRATIALLQMNRKPNINMRTILVSAGLHPPKHNR
jgi:hypothetical protein